MPSQPNYGDIVHFPSFDKCASASKLIPLHYSKDENGLLYAERYLQNLIADFPGLLPIASLEPAYADMKRVCEEFEIRGKFIDNIFVTSSGEIAIVECKLWRNPEARREVVGQIIDYASMLSRLSYEQFESGILKAKSRADGKTLFQVIFPDDNGDEAAFHDAVTRTLRRGRFLLMIVGDGIREGLETMTEYLQQHAGLQFTFSLIELGIFKLPEQGGYIAQSRILGQSRNIERTVVILQDGRVESLELSGRTTKETPRSISLQSYYEALGSALPHARDQMMKLLQALEDEGTLVKPDMSDRTLTLRWLDSSIGWNLGTVTQDGTLWMDYHSQQARNANLSEESRRYLHSLAGISPNLLVTGPGKSKYPNLLTKVGPAPNVTELLTDEGIATWTSAIRNFQREVHEKDQR
jgi:hypothetical protein